jgi:hypothetical protein
LPLSAVLGAALPLLRQEKDLLGGVGASAVGAGVRRAEVAQADLGAKVGELADKVVQDVTEGGSRG